MHPMMLALLAGALTAPTTAEGHPEPSPMPDFGPMPDMAPPLPRYRPDLSLDMNREARRRPSYRMRGIGVTRSQRNPRR